MLFGFLIMCSKGAMDQPGTESVEKELQNGDIIFQVSRSAQSRAIRLATKSKYSHMGIVYRKGGEFYVYEAVQPVKLTPFEVWTRRGENMHYVVKRLKNSEELLTEMALQKLKEAGDKYKNRNYDIYFEWSDDRMYCSELVWKMYKEAVGIEIGKLQKLKEFDLSSEEVQAKIRERYGDDIPFDEMVISPAEMFNSEVLEMVFQN